MTCRIIGCGNLNRGDDAAGILVARRLRELGVPTEEENGDPFAMMDRWIGADRVILVDAVLADAQPGTIQIWNANRAPLPKDPFCCSTHAFGVREAVELARILGRLPPSLLIYGIVGRQFQRGTSASLEVQQAVEHAAQQIAAEFGRQGP